MSSTYYSTIQTLSTSLQVTTASGTSPRALILSIFIENLKIGDKVILAGQIQITNNLSIIVSCSRYLIRATSETDTNGLNLVRPAGTNITPNPGEHHLTHAFSAIDDIDTAGSYYYNVLAYSASSDAQPGDTVVVENNNYLQALVLSGI